MRSRSDNPSSADGGAAEAILLRQAQTELKRNENTNRERRFLEVEMFDQSPMTAKLSGLNVEYVLALIHCSEAGTREATIAFDVGEGTQDLGFRSEVPVLFSVRPAIPVKLAIRDADGEPTTARLEFRDLHGRVYPPQAKRLAPDFFFQPQIYRKDGDVVLLPPGEFTLESSRGPEYVRQVRNVTITDRERSSVSPPVQVTPEQQADATLAVNLQRWINPADSGFFSGDHHIHAAGCSHYDNPTQGVTPSDMFNQVKGEGLNVGCVLTWGPDFPCMSSRRVGQGRVYVQLGKVKDVDFSAWCGGIAAGRSYVSDGYAHATSFTVNGSAAGTEDVALAAPAAVIIETSVAFAPEQP